MVISGSSFIDNDATILNGAGTAVNHGSLGSLVITNTQFISNAASGYGGAIAAVGQGDISIVDSTFSTNRGDGGGAIYRSGGGDLAVTGGTFNGNQSTSYGGAIFNSGTPVLITGVTFADNTAVSLGGALFAFNGGSYTIYDSQSSGNTAGSNGGALYQELASVTIADSRFENNSGGSGGAIYYNAYPNGGNFSLERSLILNNEAVDSLGSGGGLWVGSANYQIYESVIANNQASHQGGGFKSYAFNASGTIRNTTFSDNSAGNSGGNLHHEYGTLNLINVTFVGGSGGNLVPASGTVTAVNTIVSGGGACGAPLTSQGHNLENGNSCGFNQSGDLINTDPLLGPLQDNGGDTLTHLPSVNSLALENGDDAACPSTDQRGVSRPQNVHCDMGAVEAEPNLAPIADAGPDQSAQAGGTVTLDGSGSSDPDGDYPLAYQWTQTGGPVVTLNNPNTASPMFTIPISGMFTFQLVVTDSLGLASTPDTVVVIGTGGQQGQIYIYLPVIQKPSLAK